MNKPTFNRFDEIEHMPLRVYNRGVMAFNILNDFGKETLKEYFETFNTGELLQIAIIQEHIKKFGVKKTYKEVTKDMKLQDDEEVYVEIDGLTA